MATYSGTIGDDILTGGAGNDIFYISAGNDSIDGGSGTDKLIIDLDLSTYVGDLWYSINGQEMHAVWNRSYAQINGALAGGSPASYVIGLGSFGTTTAVNVEQYQVDLTGTASNDLLIYQNGTRYYGGDGYDTFFANWSKATMAVVWNNAPDTVQTVNGVSVSGLERLLVATGSGNDVISNNNVDSDDEIYMGAGNDTFTASAGSDYVDGDAGTDKLVIDVDLSAYVGDLWYSINGQEMHAVWNRSYAQINGALAGGSPASYVIGLGSFGTTTAVNVEQYQVDLTGTASNDLLIYQNGTRYYGGDGYDTFFANWSKATMAVVWNNAPDTVQTVNGVSVSGLERLLVATGSGNDVISNNNVDSDDEIYMGAGNDTFTASAGSDYVDGGAGTDKLVIDVDLSAYVGDLWYSINGQEMHAVWNRSYAQINGALAGGSPASYVIGLGSFGTTTAVNVEQYQVDLTGTASNDLLIYQNGTRYYGGDGFDTFFANWSKATTAIVWDNTPDTVQTVNGVSVSGLERLLVATGSGNDVVKNLNVISDDEIYAGAGNDIIASGAGNDMIDGGKGNDTLDGGTGADTLIGGTGKDKYVVDNVNDVVIETSTLTNEIDSVSSSVTYTLGANLENLALTGIAAIDGVGNELNNKLLGNKAANTLIGGIGTDTLTGGDGSDFLIGGVGKDIYNLAESKAATDTVQINAGESQIDGVDVVNGFALGTGGATKGVDKLDLPNTFVATNIAAVDGIDAGIIRSHAIANGIISFDDANSYASPLVLAAGHLDSVFSYLQANITSGETVGFTALGNTYVFQDEGANDIFVQLTGVTAASLSTTGLVVNSVWIA
ncbi:hypothetical protein KFZ76_22985 [Methylovulum psychrotolerans]|uniref:beta strand repeat-containing protein n=1 Tax=Methylovulum psychrotolerans TaxID=1704499 RepID=UPI001BFF897A|nr:calcium-binding protein [Methylovulum psychrotolerans]MBT9100570.1 hypothetical protein [Methylovulum psychrotolerans]